MRVIYTLSFAMKDFLKSVSNFIFGSLGCVAYAAFFITSIIIAVIFIAVAARISYLILPWLVLISLIVFLLDIFVVLPLAIFKKTRAISSYGLIISSYIYGLSLWLWSLLITYILWGVTAVYIGIAILGVGVVPFAILASAFHGQWSITAQIILLIFITYGSRIVGLRIAETVEEPSYDPEIVDDNSSDLPELDEFEPTYEEIEDEQIKPSPKPLP